MKQKLTLFACALSPVVYPLVAFGVTGTLDGQQAIEFLGLAALVSGASVLGAYVATRVRFFRGSRFWASEAGILITLYGFLGPMMRLMPDAPLFVELSRHILMLVLLTISCLAGIGAIFLYGFERQQPRSSRPV